MQRERKGNMINTISEQNGDNVQGVGISAVAAMKEYLNETSGFVLAALVMTALNVTLLFSKWVSISIFGFLKSIGIDLTTRFSLLESLTFFENVGRLTRNLSEMTDTTPILGFLSRFEMFGEYPIDEAREVIAAFSQIAGSLGGAVWSVAWALEILIWVTVICYAIYFIQLFVRSSKPLLFGNMAFGLTMVLSALIIAATLHINLEIKDAVYGLVANIVAQHFDMPGIMAATIVDDYMGSLIKATAAPFIAFLSAAVGIFYINPKIKKEMSLV